MPLYTPWEACRQEASKSSTPRPARPTLYLHRVSAPLSAGSHQSPLRQIRCLWLGNSPRSAALQLAGLQRLTQPPAVTTVTLGSLMYNQTLVNALLISVNQLYMAGAPVTLAGGVQSSGLARVNLLSGAPDAAFTQAVALRSYSALTPEIHDLVEIGNSVYLAGNFTNPVGTGGA